MIKMNIFKNIIEVSGHSNYSDYGTDIVCASVSSILITTVNSLIKLDSNSINYVESDGYVKIEIKKHNETIDIIIGNMIDLFKELENKYKKNIKIIEEV